MRDIRLKHIRFIQEDTKQRGETIVSGIIFMGALYQCSVKKEGSKRAKTVDYSAAENVIKGYRKITPKEH